MARTYVRACPYHNEPLIADTLKCPRGHEMYDDDRVTSIGIRWSVLELPTRRCVAHVYPHRTVFQGWFRAELNEMLRRVPTESMARLQPRP